MWLPLVKIFNTFYTATFVEQFSCHENGAEFTVFEQEFKVQNGSRMPKWEWENVF